MTVLDEIIEYLHYHSGVSRRELMDGAQLGLKDTQVKDWLSRGIESGDIKVDGKGKATKYSLSAKGKLLHTINLDTYYKKPLMRREVQTGYNFELIRNELPSIDIFTADEYRFLNDRENAFRERIKNYPKELYAKEMERLGIDLSWKSAQIEGNTYTLLETVNLLKDKIEAEGKKREEAIMLLNHKSALKAIIDQPEWFQRLSIAKIEDLHSILIEELGVDRNLRHARVGISGTNYRPIEVASQIREAMEDLVTLVNIKSDPYEKALLCLLLIAYIQPFTDGNKRTSRLTANACLLAAGVCPLSFRSVEADDYRAALLLFYEQNNVSAFKRIFLEQVEFACNEYF